MMEMVVVEKKKKQMETTKRGRNGHKDVESTIQVKSKVKECDPPFLVQFISFIFQKVLYAKLCE